MSAFRVSFLLLGVLIILKHCVKSHSQCWFVSSGGGASLAAEGFLLRDAAEGQLGNPELG